MLDTQPGSSRPVLIFSLVVSAFVFWRLYLAFTLGLGDDEGYYFDWAQHLDWGYFDHPPLVSWIMHLGQMVLPRAEWAVRLPFILLSLITVIGFFKLSETFERAGAGLVTALTFGLLPAFAFGSWMAFPDIPMIAAWVWALYFCRRLEDKPQSWCLWLGLAALCGLAVLSKLTGLLLVACVGLWVLTSTSLRTQFWGLRGVLGFLLFAVLISPILIWNARHDFPTLKFQLINRHSGDGWSLSREMQFVLVQILLVSPLVFFGAVRQSLKSPHQRWLACFTWFPLGVFLFQALNAPFMIHWAAPTFLATLAFIRAPLGSRRWTLVNSSYLVALNALYLLICSDPILPLASEMTGRLMKPSHDFSNDFYGWPEAAQAVESAAEKIESETGVKPRLVTSRYQLAGNLSFYSGELATAVGPKANAYRFFGNSLYGENINAPHSLFIADNRYDAAPGAVARFEHCQELEPVYVFRGSTLARTFRLWHCLNFQGPR